MLRIKLNLRTGLVSKCEGETTLPEIQCVIIVVLRSFNEVGEMLN